MHKVVVAFVLLRVGVEGGDLLVEGEVLFGGVGDKKVLRCNSLPIP